MSTPPWAAAQAVTAEVRLYDRLFTVEQPDAHETKDFKEFLNPGSLAVAKALVEPALVKAKPGGRSSSSGWAISWRTARTASPGPRCSTAP